MRIIDVKKNDSIFRIISPKKDEGCSDEIKIGRKYPLNLLRLYPNKFVQHKDNEALNNPRDSCFMPISKKSHYSLYVASNLNGLCMSDNKNDTEELTNRFGIVTMFCDACKGDYRFLLRLYMR